MYQMPVRAIKNILKKELEEFKDSALNLLHKGYVNDATKELIYIAHNVLTEKLEACNDYDSLDEFVSFVGYRMSLEEWINSL